MSFFTWIVETFFGGGAKERPQDEDRKPTDTPVPAGRPAETAAPAAAAPNAPPTPSAGADMAGSPGRRDPSLVRILVAPFQRDREGQFTQRFIDTLKTGQSVEIERLEDAPAKPSGMLTTKTAAAIYEAAAACLGARDGDLLVLGELSKLGLRLYLLPSEIPAEARPDCFGIGDSLVVSPNFDADAANLIYAAILTAALPAKKETANTLVPDLLSAAEKSMGLLNVESAEREPAETASLMTHIGVIAATSWRLNGQSQGLNVALKAFRRASSEGPKEISPLVLAELKVRLATTLKELAAARGEVELYDEAADALESVASVLNRSSHTREWGMTYQCLGSILLTRGQKEAESSDCVNAVKAFDAALQVFTKDAHLSRWAEVMNLRGTAFMVWGAMEAGTKELGQAVETYREVLAARNQTSAPLYWAQASNNLGTAAFALAKRTKDGDLMREAAACFDGALAVYQQHGQSQAADVARKNIQRVERLQASG